MFGSERRWWRRCSCCEEEKDWQWRRRYAIDITITNHLPFQYNVKGPDFQLVMTERMFMKSFYEFCSECAVMANNGIIPKNEHLGELMEEIRPMIRDAVEDMNKVREESKGEIKRKN